MLNRWRTTSFCLILAFLLCACDINVRIEDAPTPQPTHAAAAADAPTDASAPPTPAPPASPTSQTPRPLAVGQLAVTLPDASRELWTAADRGEHVVERPRLYGGARLKILALAAQAVQVRTEDAVEGWIHEPAERALTSDLAVQGEREGFAPGAQIQIIWPSGIPLRAAPRSDAQKVREALKVGQRGALQQLLGDWLQITLEDGASGWARWYYDGKRYAHILLLAPATPFPGGSPTAASAIVYQRPDGSLWRADASAPPVQLAPASEPGALIPWAASPDGRLIAFVSGSAVWPYSYRDAPDAAPSLALWLVGSDGSNPRKIQSLLPPRTLDLAAGSADQFNLLPALTAEQRLAWSPDGSRVAFVSAHESQIDLYAAARDGSVARLTSTPQIETQPRWSPDGGRIACLTTDGLGTGAGWGGLGLAALPSDGGAPAYTLASFPLNIGGRANYAAAYRWIAPDKLIVNAHSLPAGGSEYQIVVVGQPRAAPIFGEKGVYFEGLAWSDAAQTLAIFDADQPNTPQAGLHLWRRGEEIIKTLVPDPVNQAAWSPQGDLLAYSVGAGSANPGVALWSPGVAQESRRLAGRPASALHWSLDGQQIAIDTGAGDQSGGAPSTDLLIFKRDGAQLPGPPGHNIAAIGWGRQGLFFASRDSAESGARAAKLWLWDGKQAHLIDQGLEWTAALSAGIVAPA